MLEFRWVSDSVKTSISGFSPSRRQIPLYAVDSPYAFKRAIIKPLVVQILLNTEL